MRYQSGKRRIAKRIVEFIRADSDASVFVDLFMGAGSVVAVAASYFEHTVANDLNTDIVKLYEALHRGWVPPELTDAEAKEIHKNLKLVESSPLLTLIGYGCSFGGIRGAGFAGNYNTSKNSLIKKANKTKATYFTSLSYEQVFIPHDSVIYCDIPYDNTQGWEFDHESFYAWAEAKKEDIYVSEYEHNVPSHLQNRIVWQHECKRHISKASEKETTEVLIKL